MSICDFDTPNICYRCGDETPLYTAVHIPNARSGINTTLAAYSVVALCHTCAIAYRELVLSYLNSKGNKNV